MNGSTTIDKRGGAAFSARAGLGAADRLGPATDLEQIDPDRLGDILEFSLAKVPDHEIKSPLDLPVGILRQADRAGLSDPFEARGNIDAVAHQVSVALFNHIAKMNADAEFNRRSAAGPRCAPGVHAATRSRTIRVDHARNSTMKPSPVPRPHALDGPRSSARSSRFSACADAPSSILIDGPATAVPTIASRESRPICATQSYPALRE